MVSETFRMNFWQHVMFEVAARHLLYAYSKDIEDALEETMPSLQQHTHAYAVKPQLISYLGGEAGTGKSTVVEALLTFAKQWGREGSVETLAFTGAAAINIHGKTMHSARNLKLNGAEPSTAPSIEMKARFNSVVMVIIDEISITNQALLGGTDTVSRTMSPTPHRFMGGKHVILIGDFLQLPPVGGHPCYQVPPCSANRLRHAGYNLYSSINFVVFLTQNMRARMDPVYAEILDNLRWGRLTDAQLSLLNTRVKTLNNELEYASTRPDEFHRPFVVCTNKLRCAINHKMLFTIANLQDVKVYECIASSSSRSKKIVENLSNATDDLTSRIPIKLLFYVGMPVTITRKHPLLLDADVIANGVVGRIVGIHPPPNQLDMARYTVGNVEINRFVQHPELLLVKLHGCHVPLISGLPDGVIGIPPLHVCIQLKGIPNLSQASVTVDQFAVVPAFACTTEKLQGQTCHNGVVVTPLNRRKGSPKQTFYVALSRATTLDGLTLTEKVTREYLQSFQPDEGTINEMLRLVNLVELPPYATEEAAGEFKEWKSRQHP